MSNSILNKKVICFIPTLNGAESIGVLLDSLAYQDIEHDIFAVDSGSTDGTITLLKRRHIKHQVILKNNFDHGGTRQLMIDLNPNYEFYVFMTQDAYLNDYQSLRNIISPFDNKSIGAVCGRQLPHLNASPLAIHARNFNYPEKSQVRSLGDVPEMGLRVAFMSNSFAAYRAKALFEAGGFPRKIIFGEDMYLAAKIILLGNHIAYAADAKCYHSHNYSLAEEFKRYFDMGVFHNKERWIKNRLGGPQGEGLNFIKSEMMFLRKFHPSLLFLAMLRNSIKLIAFKIGTFEKFLPNSLKLKIGLNKSYWS